MRERLLFHLRGLPQIVESWNRTEDNDSQPSIFARSITKVIFTLHGPLSCFQLTVCAGLFCLPLSSLALRDVTVI